MTPAPRRRTGFTLVELLVVITIIGILVGLLVPVIWGAVGRGNDARVAAEINTLGQALASFKNKYQEYPPSRIVLPESGGFNIASTPVIFYGAPNDLPNRMNYGAQSPMNIGGVPQVAPAVADVDYATLAQRSITYLRKFFPKAQFNMGAAATGIPGPTGQQFYDFNGNGVLDTFPIYLEGHECLVFFLGGIPVHTRAPVPPNAPYTLEGVSGFGANPRNPFRPEFSPTGSADPIGQNRVEPFFEFRAERLVDDDLDGIPGYIDPLGQGPAGRYFAYFSSYGGSGYDPNDVNFNGAATNDVGQTIFSLSFPVTGNQRQTNSPMPNPYTSGLPVVSGDKPASFHNAQSYQIIAAGRDRLFGAGGQYTEGGTSERLPGPNRQTERDNVTNFSNGTLD